MDMMPTPEDHRMDDDGRDGCWPWCPPIGCGTDPADPDLHRETPPAFVRPTSDEGGNQLVSFALACSGGGPIEVVMTVGAQDIWLSAEQLAELLAQGADTVARLMRHEHHTAA